MTNWWLKQAVDFWWSPKIVNAGHDAGTVFQVVIAINAMQDRNGQLTARESSARYLATLLNGVGFDFTRTEAALDRCIEHELLVRQEDKSLRIVGWDATWAPAKSDAARQRARRIRNGHPGAKPKRPAAQSGGREP